MEDRRAYNKTAVYRRHDMKSRSFLKKGNAMDDIEQKVKKYCNDMADTLVKTMEKFDYPEYRPLWEIFIRDARNEDYYRHFNSRLVNGEIAVQARTNVGVAITDYTDRLQECVDW